MKMKRTTSKEMALCGVLAALALTVMILGGMFPAASYCCPVLACILLVPVVETCGRRIAWAWYGAVALLSCLLCPDPEAAALFLFLGYYPIIKGPLDLFLVACALMYTALLFVLSLEQVAETFRQEAPWMLAVGLALGILTFFLTDFLLTRLEAMWRRRTGKRSE